MPAAVPFAYMRKDMGWGYQAGPEPHLDGRLIDEKRGRVIGGSSSINAMIFNRGNPRDFDGWSELGLPDWDWSRCLPYFQRMETFAGPPGEWRGTAGPLRISRCKADFPIYDDFLRSGERAGFSVTPDHNGRNQEGLHIAQAYIGNGVRSSAANAYLHPIAHRDNLHVRTGIHVTRVLMEGNQATGVEVASKGGLERIACDREVILAAGAFGSPQLLMLSGIGDPEQLRQYGVGVRIPLRDVGEHLENHPGVNLQFAADTKYSLMSRLGPLGKARLGIEWLLLRSGLGTTNFFEAGAFLRTNSAVGYANVQLEFLPLVRYIEGGKLKARAGFSFWIDLSRPVSRGRVQLRSASPFEAPSIVFNHLADASDLRDLVDAVRLTREIVRRAPLGEKCKAELAPGPAIASTAALEAWLARNVGTSYHPSGTCRMGTGEGSVVDSAGRVHGAKSLRVVDASIMPTTVTANISAAVYMLAEKISDEMLGRACLQARLH
jgi:choline dehydrogenase